MLWEAGGESNNKLRFESGWGEKCQTLRDPNDRWLQLARHLHDGYLFNFGLLWRSGRELGSNFL